MGHTGQALYNPLTEPCSSRPNSESSIAVSLDPNPSTPFSDSGDAEFRVEESLKCPADTLVNSRSGRSEGSLDSRSLINNGERSSLKEGANDGSQPLSQTSQQILLRCIVNIALAVLPVLFISLAVVAAGLHGRDMSSLGQKVQEAAKLGPTIYPIVFAAIVTRFLRHLAQWQAEKGQSLGEILEQLVQSQSFAGSIQAALKLRNIHPISIAITIIWALSPIGGQTSLRLLSVVEAQSQNQIPNFIRYPNGDSLKFFCNVQDNTFIPGVIDNLLGQSLNTANITRQSAVDGWGNIKIPRPDSLVRATPGVHNGTRAPNPWLAVAPGNKKIDYSSLIGIPLWDIPDQGTANFSLEWPIYDTECHWETPGYNETEWEKIVKSHETNEDLVPCPNNIISNSSVLTSNFTETAVYQQQLSNSSSPSYIHLQYSVPGSHVIDNVHYTGFRVGCKLRTYHVEAEVFCQNGACSVAKIRRSEDDWRPDFLTPWSDISLPYDPAIKSKVFIEFLQFLPGTIGATTSGYISGRPYINSQDETTWWKTVSDKDFSLRFSQIFNTIWIASQWPLDIKYRRPRTLPITALKFANATVTEKYPVYQTNFACVGLLLTVSSMLLLCALGSLVLELSISAPDIFGFVSSLTRDSDYFEPIPGGSVLSGPERARRLKDVRVQIADVRSAEKVGHIALTRCGERGMEGVRPRLRTDEGRVYD